MPGHAKASGHERAPRKPTARVPRLDEIPCPVLQAAATRVAARHSVDLPDSIASSNGTTELLVIAAQAVANQRDRDLPPSDPRLNSASGKRVLDALRAELVRGSTTEATNGRASEILRTVVAFERVRDRLDPDRGEYLAQELSGPDGLDLVVEVAHDLRSPLTSILFLAETLQQEHSGPVTELQHRQLGLIYSAALGLSTLVSNMMEMARGGNRLTSDTPEPFSVTDVFEAVHDIVRPMAEEKGLTIRVFPPAADHRLGFPQALSRVLLNLTTNAIKFTEEGFVEIVARATSLTGLEFSVRDTGPGISDSSLATLYQPFRRGYKQNRLSFSGTGLGLALSRKLVEVMGSALCIETRPNWGSRLYFQVDLPIVTNP